MPTQDVNLTLQQDGADLAAGNPLPVADSRLVGTWGYASGVDGTLTLDPGLRVIAITCVAGDTGGSLSIDGGDIIPIPASVGLTLTPQVQLDGPTLEFTDTTTFVVEYLT